jgi:hypothetical protein
VAWLGLKQETAMNDQGAAAVAAGSAMRDGSYVDWPCAFAGAITASALSFVLFTFGTGVGLSMASPWSGTGASFLSAAIIPTVWVVLVQVSAFAAGGYLAGRMRRPWADARASEVEFRDGVHGALVWAVGVAFGAVLLASTATGMLRVAADAGGSTMRESTTSNDTANSVVDALLRVSPTSQDLPMLDTRGEAVRLVATGIGRNDLNVADRTYLVQLVAARTGLSPADADKRVSQVFTSAKEKADRSRKIGVLAAFLAASSLLAGCAAAWSASRLGGMHRDQGIIWRGFARRPAGSLGMAQRRT